MDITTYQDRSTAWQMIAANRADIVLTSSAIAAAVAQDKSDVLQMGFTFLTGIKIGVAVAKGRGELEQAIADGIAATQASGEIAKIYTAYRIDPNLLIPPAILTQ